MSTVEEFRKSIAEKNIKNASVILSNLYKQWGNLSEEDQLEIKRIEPVYLSIIHEIYQ